MSHRRLAVLLRHLPPESATKTALREAMTDEELAALRAPEGYGPWSFEMHLLAGIADGIQLLAWQNTRIHGGGKATPPDPIPRPGVTKKAGLTAPQVEYLTRLRERQRAVT